RRCGPAGGGWLAARSSAIRCGRRRRNRRRRRRRTGRRQRRRRARGDAVTRPLRLFLRTGEEVPLAPTFTVEDLTASRPNLKKLHAVLTKRFRRSGHTGEAATELATGEIDNLLRAMFMDFGDAFVGRKKQALQRLIELQGEVFEVY